MSWSPAAPSRLFSADESGNIGVFEAKNGSCRIVSLGVKFHPSVLRASSHSEVTQRPHRRQF